jgi:hypothetical protein
MKKILLIMVSALVFSGTANAALIEFVPGNDTAGQIYTTNNNDAWDDGRGIVFQMLGDATIDSVGLFQDLTNVNLSFELAQVNSASGNVTSGQTVLASGSGLTTTSGLEWIDFGISNLLLGAGNFYHLEFTFAENSNQNFFYNNANVAFTQGSYSLLEGTQNGLTTNSVLAAFRLNEADSTSVPEPATFALFGLGLAGISFSRKKKRA